MARTPKKPSVAEAPSAEAATVAAPAKGNKAEAKARFSKAIEEARAGAEALGKEARERGDAYRGKLQTTVAAKRNDLVDEARAIGNDAKDRAAALANDGKARASDALSNLGKIVADNAPTIDEHLGEKYGDYARTAARQIQETAAKIDSKDLTEIGADARDFVRRSPGLAIGVAAVAGFLLARLFRSGDE